MKILGIDVGGTFTDFVLLDRESGSLISHKQPSTPAEPAAAVESGIRAIVAQARTTADTVSLVVHGTTIALNAILQRRGARLALVVSPGNRDILELARVRIRSSFDFFALPEPPLVTRDCVVEIAARLDRLGVPVSSPDAVEYDRVAARIAELGVDAVAVVLLHAYANPRFEAEVAAALADRLGLPLTASSAIWSASREYERASVAVMNAYVSPIMRQYYASLETTLLGLGLRGETSMTTSNGGSVDLATAYARPIDSILSGPASGVVAAIDAGFRAGFESLVTFDMGGTSADIAVAIGRAPEITAQSMLGEFPLIVPVVNVNSIGAGGGSLVRVDEAGFLKVGPESAGAVPGPACFDRGGTHATITDCYLVCGWFDPDRFAAGQIPLSVPRAVAALEAVADGLGYTGVDRAARAADAAVRVAGSMMATEVRKALARRGHDPAAFTLVPYGGAGPTHAAVLADQAGLERILVAPRPGVFCALGAAMADLRRDFVHGGRLRFGGDDHADRHECARVLALLSAEARRWARDVGDRASEWREQVSADIRYADQAYDITITLTLDREATLDIVPDLQERFHVDHHRLYGFDLRDSHLEFRRLVFSEIGVCHRPPVRVQPARAGLGRPDRDLYLDGVRHRARIIDRDALQPGDRATGPAIVEQADTTIVVPPGWQAEALSCASLLMTRNDARPRS